MGRTQVFDWFRRFKEGRTSAESDPHSGRHRETRKWLILRVSYTMSTLPTGKQLTRNSTWRSCDVCVNQFAENDRKMVGWRLDPAPRQCNHTHFTFCATVFAQTRHRSVVAATILTRSRTMWLFPIPKAQESSERTSIWGNGGYQTKFDEDTIKHPERGVRKMFPSVSEMLGEVYSCGRELFWRRFGLKPH